MFGFAHNKPLKFVPLRSTGRSLRSRRLAGRYLPRRAANTRGISSGQ